MANTAFSFIKIIMITGNTIDSLNSSANGPRAGIYLHGNPGISGASRSLTVVGNTIRGNTIDGAIQCVNIQDSTIVGNTISDVGAYGIGFNGPRCDNVLVSGNTIINPGWLENGEQYGIFMQEDGGGTKIGGGIHITNNIISARNGKMLAGIMEDADSEYNTIENNKITNFTVAAIVTYGDYTIVGPQIINGIANVTFNGVNVNWLNLNGVNLTAWPSASGLADQNLNTTDDVEFHGITIDSWVNWGGYNLTTWPLGNLTIYDQILNTTSDVTFHDIEATNLYTLGTLLHVTSELNVNFEYAGQTAVINSSDTITQGQVLYWDSSGLVARADADASTTMPGVCFALNSTTATHNCLVLMQGWVYNSAWTLAEGDDVFVSTTSGGLTISAPSGSGDQIQVIGIGLTEDILWFNPDYTVLEVS